MASATGIGAERNPSVSMAGVYVKTPSHSIACRGQSSG